jgi:hypothetical protein
MKEAMKEAMMVVRTTLDEIARTIHELGRDGAAVGLPHEELKALTNLFQQGAVLTREQVAQLILYGMLSQYMHDLREQHMHDVRERKAQVQADKFKVLGVAWFELPIKIRRLWWRETDFNRKPPSPEFMERLPPVLAAAKLELENDKREIAADVAHAHELLSQARKPPCESCLRPAAPCQRRCLRPLLLPNDVRVKARMSDALLLAIRELIQAAERELIQAAEREMQP